MAELVNGPDGRKRVRMSRAEVAALGGDGAAGPQPAVKVNLFDVEAAAAAIGEAIAKSLAPLVSSLEKSAAAIAAKDFTLNASTLPIVVNVPQGPAPTVNVTAQPGTFRVAVDANVLLPAPRARKAKIVNPDGSTSTVEMS